MVSISTLWAALRGLPRWTWIGIGLILASAALWIGVLRHQVSEGREKIDALSGALRASQEQVAILEHLRAADTAAAMAREAELTRIANKEAKDRAKLDRAFRDNPEWASQPVPRSVADSLQP